MAFEDFEAVIGLEIHAQLKSKSKMFSADGTDFQAPDNENTSVVSVGMPGALPVPNQEAVWMGVKAGLALNCQIRKKSVFARKNYFYPDLPKGYQISQFDEPLCEQGHIEFRVDGRVKRVSIIRAHLEEDAGKSNHVGTVSLLNYNRAGIPLLEIVSGPDMSTPEEAGQYARTVRQILRYIGVCDGNLEEGSLRCDCNVSVRKKGQKGFGTKVEIKNINSFRFIEKALEYEIQRQVAAIESGQSISQETRLWDPDKNKTFVMRSKEEAHDYRYFPDPDLLPLVLDEDQLTQVKASLPELPAQKINRYLEDLGLPLYDAEVLTAEREMAEYFERVVEVSGAPKAASNWVMTELMRELNQSQKQVSESPIKADQLGQLVKLVESKSISGKIGKIVFQEMWSSGKDPEVIIKEKGLIQITDEATILAWIKEIIAKNPQAVMDYRGGKNKLFGFFVGELMKVSKGKASPEVVNQLLLQELRRED